MLNKNDTIAIVACSNAKNHNQKERINKLLKILQNWNLNILVSNFLYINNSEKNIAQRKALELNDYFDNKNVKVIFDISGGDYANSLLEHLNFSIIERSESIFCGYSDLTTIINAIYSKTEKQSLLFNILNIVDNDNLQDYSYNFFFKKNKELITLDCYSIKNYNLSEQVIGGNIRCFLKLAGTPYFPKTKNKVLLLESLSGNLARIETYFNQLKQMDIFNNINGLLLGQFTELDNIDKNAIEKLALNFVPKDKSIFRTNNIGHSSNSKSIIIGDYINIKK